MLLVCYKLWWSVGRNQWENEIRPRSNSARSMRKDWSTKCRTIEDRNSRYQLEKDKRWTTDQITDNNFKTEQWKSNVNNVRQQNQHILNKCMFNEGLMIKRHDHLVQKIGKKLRKVNINRKIWIECAWRSGCELLRPDITMVDEKNHYTIIEVTCQYEISKKYLQQWEEKIAKHKRLIQHEVSQVECRIDEVASIVNGSVGTIPEKTNNKPKMLKLTKHQEALQKTTMKGTVNILNSHFRCDYFRKGWKKNWRSLEQYG